MLTQQYEDARMKHMNTPNKIMIIRVNHNHYDRWIESVSYSDYLNLPYADMVIVRFDDGTEKIVKSRYTSHGFISKTINPTAGKDPNKTKPTQWQRVLFTYRNGGVKYFAGCFGVNDFGTPMFYPDAGTQNYTCNQVEEWWPLPEPTHPEFGYRKPEVL